MNIQLLLEQDPYGYTMKEKQKIFFLAMKESFDFHYNGNSIFRKWLDQINYKKPINTIEDFPFFPSSVFKHVNFSDESKSYKTIESSGTSNQLKSKIHIDSTTSKRQTVVLSKILESLIGKRKPFFIIDFDPKNNRSSENYSARFAGMSGYLLGASKRIYCLSNKNNDKIDIDFIKAIKKYKDEQKPIIIIGYTYMIYKFLISNRFFNQIPELPKESKIIHFGGWKKMYDQRISKKDFNNQLIKIFKVGLNDIFDIYGFTEQLGTVYPSIGNKGNKIPIYSSVIVRNPDTLEPVDDGEEGLLQFLSPIPHSYPGISLLNDDIGRIVKNGSNNNIRELEFEVTGRPDKAEPRGCGDTLPEDYYL